MRIFTPNVVEDVHTFLLSRTDFYDWLMLDYTMLSFEIKDFAVFTIKLVILDQSFSNFFV